MLWNQGSQLFHLPHETEFFHEIFIFSTSLMYIHVVSISLCRYLSSMKVMILFLVTGCYFQIVRICKRRTFWFKEKTLKGSTPYLHEPGRALSRLFSTSFVYTSHPGVYKISTCQGRYWEVAKGHWQPCCNYLVWVAKFRCFFPTTGCSFQNGRENDPAGKKKFRENRQAPLQSGTNSWTTKE